MRLAPPLGLGLAALVGATALHASPVAHPAAGSGKHPPPPGPSVATGRGTTVLHRFDFTARARHPASVNVVGRAVFELRSSRSARYRVAVTCLRIAENRAALGGPISRAAGASRGVLFFVEDNGQGDGVDRISRLVLLRTPPKVCPEPTGLARSSLRVRRGDIVVKAG